MDPGYKMICCLPVKLPEIQFTNDEKRLIRTSWAELSGKYETISTEVFLDIYKTYPEIGKPFKLTKGELDDNANHAFTYHARHQYKFLDDIVSVIDNGHKIKALAADLGWKHYLKHVKPEYVSYVKPRIIAAFSTNMTDWTPGHEEAWDKLLEYIVLKIKIAIVLEERGQGKLNAKDKKSKKR